MTTDTISAEVNLSEENKKLKRVENFLGKVTVTRTEDPMKFIVNYPKKDIVYSRILRIDLRNFLIWFWFMSLEKEKAMEELKAKRKKGSYVS